jgi:CHAT domain-containing protein/Tfp pilus assembly protein PilF
MRQTYSLILILTAGTAFAFERPPLMEEYDRAWIAIGRQCYDDSVVGALRGIIAQDKSFYRAYSALAQVYSKRHESEAGEHFFRELARNDPGNPLAHYGLGEILRRREDLAGAVREYFQCAQQDSRVLACQDAVLDYAFKAQPNPVKARTEYFRRLFSADPANPVLHFETATAISSEQRWTEAISLLKGVVEKAWAAGERELEPFVLERLGEAAKWGLGYEQALEYDLQALRACEGVCDLDELFRVRGDIARVRMGIGQHQEGLAMLQADLKEAAAIGHLRLQANLHQGMADAYSLIGDLDRAMEHCRQSMEILGPEMEGYSYYYWSNKPRIASLLARKGDYKSAIETSLDAADRAERQNNPGTAANLFRQVGVFYGDLGDYTKALDYGTRSVKLFQQVGQDHVAMAGIGNLGSVYIALGDYSRAKECIGRALKSGRENQDIGEIQRNLENLAEVYFKLDDRKTALRLYDEALEMSPKVRYPAFHASILLGRSVVYERAGKYQAAMHDLDEGLALERQVQQKPALGYAFNREGFLNLRLGRGDRAERFFRKALELGESNLLREISWEARQGLGEVDERRGKLDSALDHYRRGIQDIEAIRGLILAPELRVGFLQDRFAIYEKTAALLGRLHWTDPGHGYDREAFRISEGSRARSFVDSLAESHAQITKGISAEQRSHQGELRAAISRANVELMHENTAAKRAALETAENALADWVLELHDNDPRYRDLQYPEPYTLERSQKELLHPGEILVEYFLAERESFAWAVTASSCTMVKLPGRAAIESHVREYRRQVSERPTSEAVSTVYRELSKRLYAELLAPALGKTGSAQELLIVPDGILYYLPFETLISPRGRFVVEDYALTYAPSASVACGLRRDALRNGPQRRELLAFGDPAFARPPHTSRDLLNQPAGEVVRSAMEARGWRFAPLPMTRVEVQTITQMFPAGSRRVYLGAQASESAVKREQLSSYKRIHFATHAILDEDNPDRSGIVLALPGTDGEDGILQAREIFDLDLRADLVVLSACQTALGRIVRGEGMVGLARAFFYAGATRVAVSLWKVNDASTAEFMKSFYAHMQRGADATAALRAAKLDMLRSGVPTYRHPYYWAPFILTGA